VQTSAVRHLDCANPLLQKKGKVGTLPAPTKENTAASELSLGTNKKVVELLGNQIQVGVNLGSLYLSQA